MQVPTKKKGMNIGPHKGSWDFHTHNARLIGCKLHDFPNAVTAKEKV